MLKILIILFSLIPLYCSAADNALSLKGAAPGMTLNEFKGIATPVPKEYLDKNNFISTRVFCHDLGNDIKSCSYQALDRGTDLWIDIRVGFAGLKPGAHLYEKDFKVDEKETVKSIFYVFYQDKLMSMAIKIGTKLFDTALPSFLSYYGKPTSHVDKAKRNPYGVEVGNIRVKWIDDENELYMQKFKNSSTFGQITFTNTALLKKYTKKVSNKGEKTDF